MPGSPIELMKGQNAPLPGGPVTVTVDLPAAADLSALLVTAAGTVRSDADFLFFNQPDGPGVRCVPPAGSGSWQIRIEPARIPSEIEQVRVVSNLEQPGLTFGALSGPPVAELTDASGAPLIRYRAAGLGSESILIALEVYRRGADWKVRAVGQGYAGGLADLIRDHGVTVDDPGPAVQDSVPPPPGAPAAPPVPLSPPGAPAAAPPAAPAPSAAGIGEISLVKGRSVNLQKGQRISLRKEDGSGLGLVRMGLGWDPVKETKRFSTRTANIDLDASAVMFAGAEPVDTVYFGRLQSKDGSVRHSGDNLTGEGAGDDETLFIDLQRMAPQVDTVLFLVTSYRGQTFEQVQNAFCRLIDDRSGAELTRYTLAGGMPFTAMVMAKVYRDQGAWKMQAIGEGLQARTAQKALPQLGRFLDRN